MTATPNQPAPSPETNRRRRASETHRRRGAPRGNRNALKSGRYTGEAKAERKRKRLLLRQLRAGLAYARSVIRARAAAERLFHILLPAPAGGKNFQKSKNNSRRDEFTRGEFTPAPLIRSFSGGIRLSLQHQGLPDGNIILYPLPHRFGDAAAVSDITLRSRGIPGIGFPGTRY
ncbi:MAG: hypothetical protein ACAH83_16650 [Alphaproteobacteria bacterium]